jgi:hypothetical protein
MSDSSEDPTEATPTTAGVDAVDGVEPAEVPLPPVVEADPVRTVTRKGAALAMTVALVVGGLIGWVGAAAFDDDDAPQLTSFQGRFPGGGGRFPGGGSGGGFPDGGFHERGPGGGLPGEGHEGEDGRPTPPWMDDDDQGEDDRQGDDDEQSDRDPPQEEQGQDQGDDA